MLSPYITSPERRCPLALTVGQEHLGEGHETVRDPPARDVAALLEEPGAVVGHGQPILRGRPVDRAGPSGGSLDPAGSGGDTG